MGKALPDQVLNDRYKVTGTFSRSGMNARPTGDPVAPRKLNAHLTPVIEEITLPALAREPGQRCRSAAEMKEELDDYEHVELTGHDKRLQAPQIWRTRWRLGPLIAGFLVLQVFVALIFRK